MMTAALIALLIASAAFPTIAAVGSLISALCGNRILALRIARLGSAGGTISAGFLTILLSQQQSGLNAGIRSPVWTWFSFSSPQSPSISFGLTATALNAGLVCLFGILALYFLSKANLNPDRRLALDDVVAGSFLYLGGTLFVFAPNTAQAFLGWCVVSLLAAFQLRKSRDGRKQERPTHIWNRLQNAGNAFESLERFWLDAIWQPITRRFPDWLTEQAEEVDTRSNSLQILATVLGTSVILLTWLL